MFIEDLSIFINPHTPGYKLATVGGVGVDALFDNGFALGAVGMSGMASTQPTLTMATALAPADPVGVSVVVNLVGYLCVAHEPDGTGLSRLLLELA
jgi:hypothetical protein